VAIDRGLHPAEKVKDYQQRGWWSEETLDQLFAANVASRGSEPALVDPANRQALLGTAPRRLTWDELDSEVTALTARLLELGIGRGDVVGVQLPNAIELAEVYLAAWKIGAVVSPLAMQYREREIETMASEAQFDAFITCSAFGGRSHAVEAQQALAGVGSIKHLFAYGPAEENADLPEGVALISPAPADEADRELVAEQVRRDPNDPNDAVTICWTSGTESTPKAVPRAHLEWIATTWGCVDAPRIVSEDVLLNPFPMINMAALAGMFLPWLRTGCVLVQHHPFDPQTFFGQVMQERITYTVAPPAVLWMLLHNEQLLGAITNSSLTRIGSGSVPLQPAMVKGWQDHGISIINFFGSNEGIGLLSSPEDFPQAEERARYFPRYGTPGKTWSSRVSEWVQLRLVDPTTEEEITEPGIPGELRVGGPTVFAGYLNQERLADPFDDHGFLRTGDLFEIAGEEGQYLRYLDRAKDIIIRGGMNIAPAELEALIAMHPAVLEVAVVGDPDEVMGERVAAVVALRPDITLTLEQLVDFLRERKIASFKLPERLEVVPELPRNPVGKILKRNLRAPASR